MHQDPRLVTAEVLPVKGVEEKEAQQPPAKVYGDVVR